MDKNSIHKSTSALIVLQHYAGVEIVCQSVAVAVAVAADLIYFCRKYTIFTKFYEFKLQKVLKFANYAVAVLV